MPWCKKSPRRRTGARSGGRDNVSIRTPVGPFAFHSSVGVLVPSIPTPAAPCFRTLPNGPRSSSGNHGAPPAKTLSAWAGLSAPRLTFPSALRGTENACPRKKVTPHPARLPCSSRGKGAIPPRLSLLLPAPRGTKFFRLPRRHFTPPCPLRGAKGDELPARDCKSPCSAPRGAKEAQSMHGRPRMITPPRAGSPSVDHGTSRPHARRAAKQRTARPPLFNARKGTRDNDGPWGGLYPAQQRNVAHTVPCRGRRQTFPGTASTCRQIKKKDRRLRKDAGPKHRAASKAARHEITKAAVCRRASSCRRRHGSRRNARLPAPVRDGRRAGPRA